MQKMRQEDKFQPSFRFLEKFYIKQKQVISALTSIYFGSSHTIKEYI